MEERVTELEVLLAFQDKRIAELDEVVQLMRAEMDRLRAELTQIQSLVSSAPTDDAPPPHW